MKAALIFLTLCLADLASQAEDIKTIDGKIYQGATIVGHNAAYAQILYNDGGAKIPIDELPPDIQKRLGYDQKSADQQITDDFKSNMIQDQVRRLRKEVKAGNLQITYDKYQDITRVGTQDPRLMFGWATQGSTPTQPKSVILILALPEDAPTPQSVYILIDQKFSTKIDKFEFNEGILKITFGFDAAVTLADSKSVEIEYGSDADVYTVSRDQLTSLEHLMTYGLILGEPDPNKVLAAPIPAPATP